MKKVCKKRSAKLVRRPPETVIERGERCFEEFLVEIIRVRFFNIIMCVRVESVINVSSAANGELGGSSECDSSEPRRER